MKKISLLIVLTLLIGAFGACTGAGTTTVESPADTSGSAPTAAGEATPKPAPTGDEIVLRYTGWGSKEEKRTTQNVFDNFEAKNPGVSVEYIHIPTDYITKLTTMIAASQGPDIAMLNCDSALQWADQGQITNIIDYLDKDPEISLDDIIPQAVSWWDKDKAAGVNGAVEVFGLYYNIDLLAEAGITVPTSAADAWSWEEFLTVCKKLTVDNSGNTAESPDFNPNDVKQFGVFVPGGSVAISYGVTYAEEGFLNSEGTALNLSGTKSIEAIQNIADLVATHHVAPSPVQSKNLPGGATALASGKVAMLWDGQWALQELGANKVNFGIGISPKMYDKPLTITLGEPIVGFTSSKHPELVWELQKAFMNPEYTLELLQSGLWMPVLSDWYTQEDLVTQWADVKPAHPDGYREAIMQNGLENGVPVLGYQIKNLPKINAIIEPPLQKVWLGEDTVENAIATVEDSVNAEVQGFYPRPD